MSKQMLRKIVEWGNSKLIMLKPNDLEDMGWKVGDDIDIIKAKKIIKEKQE